MKETNFSINRLSEMTGVDRRTLKKRLAGISPDKDGGYSAVQVAELLLSAPKELSDKAAMEVRRLKAQCERIEFENEVRRQQFIPVDDVRRSYTRAVLTFKARMFGIPQAMAQILAMSTDPIDIETRLKSEIGDAFDELNKSQFNGCRCQYCGKEIE